jgi:outer membrane immunogenic protein
MKKLHIMSAALLATIGIASSALAVDLAAAADIAAAPRLRARAPVVACTWCGFYVGGNVGGDWSRSEATLLPGLLFNQDPNALSVAQFGSPRFNRSSFTGGGQIGVNSQWLGMVVGLEVDLEYIGIRNDRSVAFTAPIAGPLGGVPERFSFTENVTDNWLSTQRLRLGWAWNQNALIYATGGLALSRQHFTQTISSANFAGGALPPGFTAGVIAVGDNSQLRAGWTVGGGLEYKLAWSGWSLRGEYLYVDLGRITAFSGLVGTAGGGAGPIELGAFSFNHENHLWTQIARVGLNYQWGALAAPAYVTK